jgi:hypothetical protein
MRYIIIVLALEQDASGSSGLFDLGAWSTGILAPEMIAATCLLCIWLNKELELWPPSLSYPFSADLAWSGK